MACSLLTRSTPLSPPHPQCAYDGSNTTTPAWPHPLGKEPWGVPMCASTEMQRLLRDPALGWEGYVISDEGSITFMTPGYHGFTASVRYRLVSSTSQQCVFAGRAADFSRNLTEKLLAYALCRQLEGYDEIVVDGLAEAIAKDGYRMQTLVMQVVTSYPFLNRRVEEEKEGSNGKKLAN